MGIEVLVDLVQLAQDDVVVIAGHLNLLLGGGIAAAQHVED